MLFVIKYEHIFVTFGAISVCFVSTKLIPFE